MSQAEVEAILAALLPVGVTFAVTDPRAEVSGLFPEEAAHVARAVPKRQREFAAGRRAARAALAKLGRGPEPILAATNRAPIWPRGCVGSISHCDDLCIALCAPAGAVASLGVDIEERAPMSETVADTVTSSEERAWLAKSAAALPVDVFSAKEAVYKALYPLSQKMLGFHELNILPDTEGRYFAQLLVPAAPFKAGDQFPLLSAALKAHVIHIMILP